MAVRTIRKDDDPILRKVSKKVDEINEKIHLLLEDMAETMYDADGVGLAAPQIGILKRLVVIDTGEGLIELINPEIIHADGLQNGVEGCLSLPGASGSVERPMKVKVRALDRNGKEFELVGTELLARAICHEVDHLEGILFTDRIKDKE